MSASVYAAPKEIKDVSECYFYHVFDLPGHGVVGEEWDLRGGEEQYLGGVSFRGKRVLQVGTASGFLCRYMESRGADVVGYDLSEEQSWDVVPFSQLDLTTYTRDVRDHIRRLNNGWWFCHGRFGSRARVVYGSVYQIPRQIGPVDVATFGSILLHLRDPFLALQNALTLTRETVVVTDICPDQPFGLAPAGKPSSRGWIREKVGRIKRSFGFAGGDGASERPPVMRFHPNFRSAEPGHSVTWWALTPQIVTEFLGVLGFEETRFEYHMQTFRGRKVKLYTVVGKRTRGLPQ